MNNLTFNFNRFILLLKKETLQGKRKVFIVAGAVFGLLAMLAISQASGSPSADQDLKEFHYMWFPILLFFGGFIFTSMSYSELDEKTGAHHYLTLPASTLEKFTSKWLITSFGFAIVFSIAYWLFSVMVNAVCQGAFGYQPEAIQFFEGFHDYDGKSLFFLIKIYLVVQTIFLAGAVMFRKYVVFKTPLTVLGIILLFSLLSVVFGRVLLWDWFDGFFEPKRNLNMRPADGTEHFFEETFLPIIKYLFWLALPLWMLTIGFFKLKEKEV